MKSSIAFTNANDDGRGLKVILKLPEVICMKNSFTTAELLSLSFLPLKFRNNQKPGTETLKLAEERLLGEEKAKKWRRTR